jgi:hypothetical protein
MSEQWLPVVGYRGRYEVSDYGRVRSVVRVVGGRLLPQQDILPRAKPNKTPKPCPVMAVALYKHGRRKWHAVSRLVLTAFVRRPRKGEEACHNDGVSWRNVRNNLRWGSRTSNEADKLIHGTVLRGEKQRDAVLTAVDVERIRDLRATGHRHREIAEWIGCVKRRQVGRVLDGTRWAHVRQ